ncbi:MAG: hypothetical protein MH204_01425, partial [Fimbriimonadaceae bacterium]|nr:hypothetical protein [Fimbriimonadaceae bacterium]
EDRPAAPAQIRLLRLPPGQLGLEGLILRALMVEALRDSALALVREPGLFRPGPGREAAEALDAAAGPTGDPGHPSSWLSRMPPDLGDMLEDLWSRKLLPPSADQLEAVAVRLREARDLAETSADSDDARLKRYRLLSRVKEPRAAEAVDPVADPFGDQAEEDPFG